MDNSHFVSKVHAKFHTGTLRASYFVFVILIDVKCVTLAPRIKPKITEKTKIFRGPYTQDKLVCIVKSLTINVTDVKNKMDR